MDRLVEAGLQDLGLSLLADWDVLVFLYRHRASLASAEQIARLLGYTGNVVADALGRLERRGLVRRSRDSCGVRFYQFSVCPDTGHDTFQRLISVSGDRAVRLLLGKKLRQRASLQRARDRDAFHLLKGSATWPKAV